MIMIRKRQLTYEKALERMTSLCARAEHCEWEIRDKLRRAALPSSDIERVIEYLVIHRFVDDSRYARAFAADKVRFAGYGRLKIRMALAAKRVASPLIAEALQSIDDGEYSAALLKMARSHAASLDLDDYEDRARLYRRLVSRGYESSLVSKAINIVRGEREGDSKS